MTDNNDNYKPPPSETLLQKLVDGNSQQWHQLVEEYSGFIFAVVKRTYNSYGFNAAYHDIEDTVAEVWKNLVENDMRVLKKCIENDNFLPTLHVISRNRSVDRMRKYKRNHVKLDEYHGVIQNEKTEFTAMDFDKEAVLLAIEHLPSKPKTLVRLFFLQRKKYREISELTGIPQNSIGPTLARAVTQLRQIMEEKKL